MKRLLLPLLLAACGPRDIVIVDLPDGGFQLPMGKPCSDEGSCKPDEFCEKDSCAASTGHCHQRLVFCKPDLDPVCGCNGVTYWNDCLRKAAGASLAASSQCSTPTTCTTSAQCGPDASCARLLPSMGSSCSTVPTGVCWVVPRTCPSSDGEAWESCGAPVCGGLCAAIRSEQVHRPLNVCP